MAATGKPSGVEVQKAASQRLRGDIAEQLALPADHKGGITESAYNLLKFHGTYEQFDRDTATERKQRGEDKEWQFMVRVRAPGGVLTAAQYLVLDRLADRYSNGTLRITTRQAFQFHGVLRENLKPTIREVNEALLTTMSACGDVVRNVITSPAPRRDSVHRALIEGARTLATALMPRSRAYHEIFLDEERVAGSGEEEEPLFGPTYLPRKFKIGLAHPGDNTVDVLANDLGLIAIFEGDTLAGWQVCIGGGMGMTHNRADTYPRLATPIAFVAPEDLVRVAEAVVKLTRDLGNRSDRKRARLKYVVDDLGEAAVRAELERHFGGPLPPARPMPKLEMPELLGWHAQGDGRYWLGVPVPSGRIQDAEGVALRSALREIIERFGADPVLTPQQDILLTNLPGTARAPVEAVLRAHGVTFAEELSPLARWALACPALPTCGLALTEAERVRAPILAQVETELARHGLEGERISLRITGCPNGCARPYQGDIGLVGRVPGQYAIFVGGDFAGTRLSFPLLERVPEAGIGAALAPLFAAWAAERAPGEGFGDFAARTGRERLLEIAAPARAA
ncbi:MAG TPA: NADPH-dependent assimilatory sulfite reductase hemoprotein subunit [Crenalkalicoccus sp.]|jgi:sulfite reductase beta subunit-like hemoprotein|nr:NADPH-dependent assimilatory sulfite reductase hemoprotein subunit [Crenalkalicoccus sp.]